MIYIAIIFGCSIIAGIAVICVNHFIRNLEKLCYALIKGRDWKYPLGLLVVQIFGTAIGMFIFRILVMLE